MRFVGKTSNFNSIGLFGQQDYEAHTYFLTIQNLLAKKMFMGSFGIQPKKAHLTKRQNIGWACDN